MEQSIFESAKWITPEKKTEPEVRKSAGYLRKFFEMRESMGSGKERKRTLLLHATAHGLYEIRINGEPVTQALFTPGCDEYGKRLQYQTYDVTKFVSAGRNEVFVTLGDGWYRGCNGIDGVRNLFGEDLSFLCRLEAVEPADTNRRRDTEESHDGGTGDTGDQNGADISDRMEKAFRESSRDLEGFEENTQKLGDTIRSMIIETDDSWEGAQDGPILLTDLELGETYDARREGLQTWHSVRTLDFSFSNLVPTETVPVTEHETFEGKLIITPNGDKVYDFGQNLAGYTAFVVENAKEGQEITLIHGETLDENGNFTIANFQPGDRNKSGGIKQEIHYICRQGRNEYKPSFSIFGFRYAKLISDSDFPAEKLRVKSIAVYSDMKETAAFTCSEESINRLFLNSMWSMKSNFCDIPTDCPTRERAGWTGDAGVFVRTGTYLMDCCAVYRKWLRNVRENQHEDGKMAYISPRNGIPGKIAEMFSASVGWGDAGVIVPYTLYQVYGKKEILQENYDMMKRWVDFLSVRASKSRLRSHFKKNPYRRYVIDTGMDYGEWCEPGANVMETMKAAFQNGQPEVATAYYAYSAGLLSEIAGILGKKEDQEHYEQLSRKAKEAYRFLFVKEGHIDSKRQCEYVRPLAFGLLDGEEAENAAADLNALVIQNDYHLNTGFLSTPFLCEVLAEHGYPETAYRLLLQKTYPGWLYAVEKGATTIWETWDGIRQDGTVHDSLNHYSYGAISGWLLSGICGIRYTHDQLVLAPTVYPLLKFARGRFDSPKGRIVSEWVYEEKKEGEKAKLRYHFEIPEGVTATIRLPEGKIETVCGGVHDF